VEALTGNGVGGQAGNKRSGLRRCKAGWGTNSGGRASVSNNWHDRGRRPEHGGRGEGTGVQKCHQKGISPTNTWASGREQGRQRARPGRSVSQNRIHNMDTPQGEQPQFPRCPGERPPR